MKKSNEINLTEIESAYDVEKITLNGECIWPVLRFKLNEELRALNGLKSRTFRPNVTILSKLIKTLFYGTWNFLRVRKFDYWVFSSSDRRKFINGVYVDRVIEPFSTEFDNTLMIENPYPLGFHYKKKKIPKCNIVSRTPFFLAIKVIKIFHRKKLVIANEDVLVKIINDTGVKLDYSAILKNHIAQYRFMKLLLGIKIPKLACFVYAASSMGFIKALKEAGVPVVEVQHGIINSMHYAYNYPKDFGNNLTPDFLLTYGKNELKIFDENNFFINDAGAILPVGYYFIDAISQASMESTLQGKLRQHYKKIVVFSLQDPFEQFTLPFIRAAAIHDPSIYYLLVPRNVNTSYQDFTLEENMSISKGLNIYECLQIADFHATINSTCAIEALYFGVPNILFDHNDWASDYYGTILNDEKHTRFVKSAEQFVKALYLDDFYPKERIIEESRLFILRNFSENMKSAINNKILGSLNEQ